MSHVNNPPQLSGGATWFVMRTDETRRFPVFHGVRGLVGCLSAGVRLWQYLKHGCFAVVASTGNTGAPLLAFVLQS